MHSAVACIEQATACCALLYCGVLSVHDKEQSRGRDKRNSQGSEFLPGDSHEIDACRAAATHNVMKRDLLIFQCSAGCEWGGSRSAQQGQQASYCLLSARVTKSGEGELYRIIAPF